MDAAVAKVAVELTRMVVDSLAPGQVLTKSNGTRVMVLEVRQRLRHFKRGSTYHRLANASLQSANAIADGHSLSVYVGEDGQMWVRPPEEFGSRFVDIGGE